MTALRWNPDCMPPIPDCVRLLRSAFPVVVTDEKRGLRYAAERFLEASRNGRTEEATRLQAAMSDAVEVVVAAVSESDSLFLKLILVPGFPSEVIVSDGAADGAVMSLAAQCAKVLGAKLVM